MPLDIAKLRHDADHATSLLRLRDIAEQALEAAEKYEKALRETWDKLRRAHTCKDKECEFVDAITAGLLVIDNALD
jgi:hypothetical protein